MSSEADQDFTDSAVREWAAIVAAAELSPLDVTMRLRRAAIVLQALMEEVAAEHGLRSLGEYDVLSVLRRSPVALSPSVVADRLMVTRSGMSGRLGRLEHLGFIERKVDPGDGRGQIIGLTRSGKARAERVFVPCSGLRASSCRSSARRSRPSWPPTCASC